jgi:rare lipoprotein A (peptidoglycan hydrolase)
MIRAAADNRALLRARCAAILAACALGAFLAAPAAEAETGGASTAASVAAETGDGLAFSAFRSAGATWYGPGFYGKQTACGQTLRPGTLGVAHRSLPCGTPVKFVFEGRQIVTRVIDRGPYSKGFSWDLTNGAREALGFEGSGRLRYAVAMQYARR